MEEWLIVSYGVPFETLWRASVSLALQAITVSESKRPVIDCEPFPKIEVIPLELCAGSTIGVVDYMA